jgi:hypothetical protein
MVHVFRQLGLHDAAEWTTVSGLSPLTPAHRLHEATVLAHSASHEIPRISYNPKHHYRIHQIPRHRFLFITRRIHSTPYRPIYLRSALILSSHLRLGLQNIFALEHWYWILLTINHTTGPSAQRRKSTVNSQIVVKAFGTKILLISKLRLVKCGTSFI